MFPFIALFLILFVFAMWALTVTDHVICYIGIVVSMAGLFLTTYVDLQQLHAQFRVIEAALR